MNMMEMGEALEVGVQKGSELDMTMVKLDEIMEQTGLSVAEVSDRLEQMGASAQDTGDSVSFLSSVASGLGSVGGLLQSAFSAFKVIGTGVGLLGLAGRLGSAQASFNSLIDTITDIDLSSFVENVGNALSFLAEKAVELTEAFLKLADAALNRPKTALAAIAGTAAGATAAVSAVKGGIEGLAGAVITSAIPAINKLVIAFAAGGPAAVGFAGSMALLASSLAIGAVVGTASFALGQFIGDVTGWTDSIADFGNRLFGVRTELGSLSEAADRFNADATRRQLESLEGMADKTSDRFVQLAAGLQRRLEAGQIEDADVRRRIRAVIAPVEEEVKAFNEEIDGIADNIEKEIDASLVESANRATSAFTEMGDSFAEADVLRRVAGFQALGAGISAASAAADTLIDSFDLGDAVKTTDSLVTEIQLLSDATREEATFSLIRLGNEAEGAQAGLLDIAGSAGLGAEGVSTLTMAAIDGSIALGRVTDTSTGLFERMSALRGVFGLTEEQTVQMAAAFDEVGEGGVESLNALVGQAFAIQEAFDVPEALPRIIDTAENIRESMIQLGRTSRSQALTLSSSMTQIAAGIRDSLDISLEQAQQAVTGAVNSVNNLRFELEKLDVGLATSLPSAAQESLQALSELGFARPFQALREQDPVQLIQDIAQQAQQLGAESPLVRRALIQLQEAGLLTNEIRQAIREGADLETLAALTDPTAEAARAEERLRGQLTVQQQIAKATAENVETMVRFRTQVDTAREAFGAINDIMRNNNGLLEQGIRAAEKFNKEIFGVETTTDPAVVNTSVQVEETTMKRARELRDQSRSTDEAMAELRREFRKLGSDLNDTVDSLADRPLNGVLELVGLERGVIKVQRRQQDRNTRGRIR